MASTLWNSCVHRLESELTEQQLNTWIRPLHAIEHDRELTLLAPNRFVLDWVENHFLERIGELVHSGQTGMDWQVALEIGSSEPQRAPTDAKPNGPQPKNFHHNLNPNFTFDSFVEGKSNQLPRAAALQVAHHPGSTYNPLLIYGGVGLGKTHLLHAIGNRILADRPAIKITYLHSERFVADMVKALQHNTISEFKQHYRSIDVLLIDDIQFFARKERSQEEFFHTFNSLLEGQRQVILTCDRYPKDVDGLEERLRSRFSWGLTQAIEPPELETRVAIVQSKAELMGVSLPSDVAFFIGRCIHSNIRELEGALRRVIANAQFTGTAITLDFAKHALQDLLVSQAKMVTIDNIQKTVAEHFRIRVSDLLSARRTRSVTRPRQIAMFLSKELTSHSLPEIGSAFGGRDHTTVLHACRRISELRDGNEQIDNDCITLLRSLTG